MYFQINEIYTDDLSFLLKSTGAIIANLVYQGSFMVK